jgi:hypothetical protein
MSYLKTVDGKPASGDRHAQSENHIKGVFTHSLQIVRFQF